jgi:hypothetical protein
VADGGQSRSDLGTLSAGYERLRAAVLSGGTGGWRLGHGVLCARGIAGWMNAFGELAPLPVSAGAAARTPALTCGGGQAPADRAMSLPDADQVVAVLAQMVLPIAA